MKQFIISLLILTSTTLYAQCQGDMNDDGVINVVDIVLQVGIVLSGETDCEDDGSCESNYDCAGVCDGDAVLDCSGECDGYAQLDECGICEGGGP